MCVASYRRAAPGGGGVEAGWPSVVGAGEEGRMGRGARRGSLLLEHTVKGWESGMCMYGRRVNVGALEWGGCLRLAVNPCRLISSESNWFAFLQ